jgi:hypothetical protein
MSDLKQNQASESRQYPRDAWDPALRKSLTVLHDRYRHLALEKDRIEQDYLRKIDVLNLWLWISGCAAAAAWVVLGGLLVVLIGNHL